MTYSKLINIESKLLNINYNFQFSKPFILMSFLKLAIKSFKECLFREIIVICDNSKFMRP